MIRLMIADDHAVVRRGLTFVVGRHPDIAVVAEADNAADVLPQVAISRPDVLLLDVSMPGPNFLQVIRELREQHPTVPILVISGHSEALYARRSIRSGASGFISKQRAEADLVAAIRAVAAGGRYVSPELAQELAADLAAGRRGPPHELLSDREHEVMLLLADGHTVTGIADALGLSVKTVSTHRTNLLGKLGLTSNAEVVRYVRAHDLG